MFDTVVGTEFFRRFNFRFGRSLTVIDRQRQNRFVEVRGEREIRGTVETAGKQNQRFSSIGLRGGFHPPTL